jgi:hypothetical protein
MHANSQHCTDAVLLLDQGGWASSSSSMINKGFMLCIAGQRLSHSVAFLPEFACNSGKVRTV